MNPRASAPLPYCASKFALVGLSEGLRAELARDGILITTVCPGLMRTGSPRNAVFKGRHRAESAWFSISAALPVLSMSAERAARRILAACARGEAEVVLSWPARLAAGVDVASRPCALRQLPRLRLRLLQPEPHVHLAVHRRGGREVQSGLLLLARASVELAETKVAVRG